MATFTVFSDIEYFTVTFVYFSSPVSIFQYFVTRIY